MPGGSKVRKSNTSKPVGGVPGRGSGRPSPNPGNTRSYGQQPSPSKPKNDVRKSMREDKQNTSKIVRQINTKKEQARRAANATRDKLLSVKWEEQRKKTGGGNGSGTGRLRGTGGSGAGANTGDSGDQGGGSSGYDYPPILPDYSIPDPPPPPVRVPERDVVELADQSVDSATIQNLLFENIGANELTKFVRHDTVEGINPYYDIISNLSDIKRKFDPSSLVSLQKSDSSLFDIYPIKLQDKIPTDDYLSDNNILDYVYFNENGDLVIEVVNMSDSEIVEVEIDRNGTIYEVGEI